VRSDGTLTYLSGSTNPRTSDVRAEPFSASAFEVFFPFEYLLLPPRSAPGHAPRSLARSASKPSPAPSYSSLPTVPLAAGCPPRLRPSDRGREAGERRGWSDGRV